LKRQALFKKGVSVLNEIDLNEFYDNLLQQVISESQSRDLMRQQAFFEIVNEELIETAEITPNYGYAYYKKTGIEVSGYGYDEGREILFLTVSEFFDNDELQTLTKSLIAAKFNRLKGFLALTLGEEYQNIVKNEVYDMANDIVNYINAEMVSKIRLFIITNGRATKNLKHLSNELINGIEIEFRVIDVEYLYQSFLLENSGGDINIDTNIPCLKIESNNDEYASYLGVVAGDQLVEMYENHGQKLFEQNVRTFLQFRGNVNKGLKETIRNAPDRFFAYNNGITATATEVNIENGFIKHLTGLQIVNGGQTTSSIYSCFKKDKLDVSNISVQLKLSVINDKGKHSNFVSKVSKYANTQNKITEADFFSNSPFHREFKDLSKRIMAPAVDGGQRKTRWYYERVRGEYLNDQAYLTPAKKRQFQVDFPTSQKIEKTFISKSEISWLRMPSIVAAGPTKSFNKFSEVVTEKIEKDNLSITEDYFKHVVSRVIMFRSLEKLISKSDWFNGGLRAQTVTYSMAYLSEMVSCSNGYFYFDKIWELQKLPLPIESILNEISKQVYMSITKPPEGNANTAMWCRKLACWDKVKNDLDIDVTLINDYLISKAVVSIREKEEKTIKRLDKGIEIQSFVVDRKLRKHWLPLYEYCKNNNELSPMKMDILNKFSTGIIPIPSEKQSKVIYDLYIDAVNNGWEF
jgi:hypothetical protein